MGSPFILPTVFTPCLGLRFESKSPNTKAASAIPMIITSNPDRFRISPINAILENYF
jgi:hypothetical protein